MEDQYVATSVVLTDANTPYNLMELIRDAANGKRPNAPMACREMTIQVSGKAANDAAVLVTVGDGLWEADHYGYELAKGESKVYRSEGGDRVYPGTKVIAATVAATVVNVEIEKG